MKKVKSLSLSVKALRMLKAEAEKRTKDEECFISESAIVEQLIRENLKDVKVRKS